MSRTKPDLDLTTPSEMLPTAKVSARAAKGWRQFCFKHGVTYASMLEAIGQWLVDHMDTPEAKMGPDPQWVLRTAKEITEARRSRQPKSET